MKIAFLIQDISTQGGTERTTICLASAMAQHGHEVSIVSMFRTCAEISFTPPANVSLLFLSHQPYTKDMGWRSRICAIQDVTNAIRTCPTLQQADCIISQKLLASTMAWYCGYRRKTIACEHYRYTMYNAFVRFWRSRLYNRMKMLVVLTQRDREAFEHSGVKRVKVIPNMVSVQPYEWQGLDSNIFVAVGRLERQKGFDMLLQAVALHKEQWQSHQLHIYGEGSEKEALLRQIESAHLESIVSLRPFEKDISIIYQQACCVVMSSRFEGFPMVLVEAAACGVPIVSFDCEEGPAVLLHNGGGLLVPNGDINALSDAMLRMQRERDLRLRSHKQLPTIVAPYLPEQIYQQWRKIIELCKIM